MLAAAGAAGAPFLTYYAQETRMYSLVVLLSILASASFALAFVRGERKHVVCLGVWLALLLYTHTWGVFLVVAMSAVWLHLRRRGEVDTRDGVRLLIVLAVALPAVAAGHPLPGRSTPPRRGPSARRRWCCSVIPGGLFGHIATAAAGDRGLLRRAPPPAAWTAPCGCCSGSRSATALLAWLCSQIEPAWATRYSAVLMGPLLLALASVVSRGRRWTVLALVGVAGVWAMSGPPAIKSNVRTVSTDDRAVDPAGRPRRLHPARDRCPRCTATCPRASSTSRRWGS